MYLELNHKKDYRMIENVIKELKLLSREKLVQKWQEIFKETPSKSLRREF